MSTSQQSESSDAVATSGGSAHATRVALAVLLVLAGLTAALVTVLARRAGENGLAGAAAVLSLLIAALLTIFIVPPLARAARNEISTIDFPFEPTSGGGVFLIIIIVVAFAAWNTANNLLFLVFSLLCSTLFVGWIAARTALKDLTISARFPDHIFAGEAAPVIVIVRNTKRLFPSFSILVEARGPKDDTEETARRGKRYHKRMLAYFSYVPHHAAAEQRVDQLFPKRGHVLIDGFELSTRFPFGFFRRRRRLRARNVDIVVYPKPEIISDELHLLPMNVGRIASLRRGAGHDLFSMRDYQPQDDLRHIDWKATARSRKLTVREFTSEDERRVTIVLDTRVPGDAGDAMEERFEHGVVQAASLVKHFIEERAEVRLVLGDEVGAFGSGIDQLYRCLRRLALVSPVTRVMESTQKSTSHRLQEAANRHVAEPDYAILLTAAPPGSIPASIWRTSHVIYL
ncbi:MAG TPA: DUF58 domain-containing protein [Pyrinomonadaceae bacterium]